jgi:hypothetical protein
MNLNISPEDHKIVKIMSKVYHTLELTMIIPWNVYMDAKAKMEITSSLKKLNTDHFTTESTEGAAMDVDDEDATNHHQLKELVFV